MEQPRDDEDDCREEAEAEAEAETDGARVAGVLTTRDDAARSVARAMAGRMIERGVACRLGRRLDQVGSAEKRSRRWQAGSSRGDAADEELVTSPTCVRV